MQNWMEELKGDHFSSRTENFFSATQLKTLAAGGIWIVTDFLECTYEALQHIVEIN